MQKSSSHAYSLSAYMLSCFSHVWLFVTPQTVAHQAPLSMGFSRQKHWSGLPFPSPGDRRIPRIEPASLMSPALAGRFFTTSATWEAYSLPTMKTANQSHFMTFWNHFRPSWDIALISPESLITWIINHFIPCWYTCGIISFNIRTNFWVGIHCFWIRANV